MKRYYIDNLEDFELAQSMFKFPIDLIGHEKHINKHRIKILVNNNEIIDHCLDKELICSNCPDNKNPSCINIKSDNFINFKHYLREEKLNRILND